MVKGVTQAIVPGTCRALKSVLVLSRVATSRMANAWSAFHLSLFRGLATEASVATAPRGEGNGNVGSRNCTCRGFA